MFLLPDGPRGRRDDPPEEFVLGLDFVLIIDPLSIFMAIVSSFIGFLIVVYSIGYISHDENQNEYYLMVVLFIGSMMGLVFSGNLIFLYLFWEITAICCWRLIGFYRLKEHVRKADKAFLVTFFGAVVMLLGFILIYGQTGTFDLTTMRGSGHPGNGRPAHPLRHALASRPPCRSTPGCRTPASPRPRSRPCSTRRCWSRSASTSSPGSSSTPSSCPAAGRTPSLIVVVVSSLIAAAAATVENGLQADPRLLHGQPDRLHLPRVQHGQRRPASRARSCSS